MNNLFQDKILPNVQRKLNVDDDITVGPVLIGDPAYPLLPGVLKRQLIVNIAKISNFHQNWNTLFFYRFDPTLTYTGKIFYFKAQVV